MASTREESTSSFAKALGVAVLLHLAGLVIWEIMDIFEPNDHMVQVLNIRLGDAELYSSEVTQPATDVDEAFSASPREMTDYEEDPAKITKEPPTKTSSLPAPETRVEAVESAPLEPVGQKQQEHNGIPWEIVADDTPSSKPTSPPAALTAAKEKSPSPAVPALPSTAGTSSGAVTSKTITNGSELGNSTKADAEAIRRYEQVISAWIDKYKRLPSRVRKEGVTVTPEVVIRVNRQGEVIYRALVKKVPYPEINHEAMNMIQRASPLPRPPANYPIGRLGIIEFRIPIRFEI